MHVGQIFNYLVVGDSVKGFLKIYKYQEDSMRLLQIKITMHKVQQFDKIVGNRGSTKSTTLPRIYMRLNIGENPVTNKGFILQIILQGNLADILDS